jgi:hypothetical protein
MTVESIQELEEGEKLLFKGRKTPLKVSKLEEDRALIEGPQGGEYQIFCAEESEKLLISKPGKRRYASYVENLRKVGKWDEKEENSWEHTSTGARIWLEQKDTGFWTIRSENFDKNLELPKYGFSDLESVEEELQKLVRENPEG